MSRTKKRVSVSTTFVLITGTLKENMIVPKNIPYIHNALHFQKGGKEVTRTLINFSSKVNAKTLAYIKPLGLQICWTDVETQKINGSSLKTFEIVIVGFWIVDKLDRARFF